MFSAIPAKCPDLGQWERQANEKAVLQTVPGFYCLFHFGKWEAKNTKFKNQTREGPLRWYRNHKPI